MRLLSLNLRGLDDLKLETCIAKMQSRKYFAMCVQETWKKGTFMEKNQGFMFVNVGRKIGMERFQGVGFILGQEAQKAWADAGSPEPASHGPAGRLASLRLKVTLEKGGKGKFSKKLKDVLLISGYAPTTGHEENEAKAFREALSTIMSTCPASTMPIFAGDLNCALGVRRDATDLVLGPFGIEHVNLRGANMYSMLAMQELCAPMTFNRGKRLTHGKRGRQGRRQRKIRRENQFGTWFHMRSRKAYSMDQWIMRRKDLRCVRRASKIQRFGVESDHYPTEITLRLVARLGKKKTGSPKTRVNRDMLRDPHVREKFRQEVVKAMEGAAPNPLMAPRLTEAMQAAASQVLKDDTSGAPEWFRDAKVELDEAVAARDRAQEDVDNALEPDVMLKLQLKKARKSVKRTVDKAQAAWVEKVIAGLETVNSPDILNPQRAWKAVKQLQRGLSRTAPAAPTKLNKPGGAPGELCQTDKETAAAFSAHFTKVFNIDRQFDPTVLERVRQRPTLEELDVCPNNAEIEVALRGLANNSAPGDNKVPSEFLKALKMNLVDMAVFQGESIAAETCTEWLCSVVKEFWREEYPEEDWRSGRLKVLPKAATPLQLRDPGKWRGIVLQDVLCKLVSAIIGRRLTSVLMREGLEEQCGFMPKRGTADGSFVARVALKKRREHNKRGRGASLST